jgi:hypothetical protein
MSTTSETRNKFRLSSHFKTLGNESMFSLMIYIYVFGIICLGNKHSQMLIERSRYALPAVITLPLLETLHNWSPSEELFSEIQTFNVPLSSL